MDVDLNKAFREIFPNPKDLKRQLVAISRAVARRSIDSESATLTLLAIKSEKVESACWCGVDADSCRLTEHAAQYKAYRRFEFEDADRPDLTLSLARPGVRLGDRSGCYLAVSYCWNNTDNSATDAFSLVTIESLDGSLRPSRASAKVLRRAVQHAASTNRKFIWIDQECIEQTDPVAKEKAIQTMDLVYRCAGTILCLLNQEIRTQDQIDLLESLHQFNRSGPGGRFNTFERHLRGLGADPVAARLLIGILDSVSSDAWFTRAWVMQERLCSSEYTSLEMWATCPQGLESSVPGEVCVNSLDQLRDAQELAFKLKDQEPVLAAELEAAVDRFKSAFKLIAAGARRRRLCDAVRAHFNALQVLNALEPQGCLIPSDKLAMLANSCGWWKRLDTREVNTHGWSFSACAWILALSNGNASFFCQDASCGFKESTGRAHWAPRSYTRIKGMSCSGLVDHIPMQIEEDGLCTEGWLWKMDSFIDLSDLRADIAAIDRSIGKVKKRAWINYEFEEYETEDIEKKLQEFFWVLLRKLSATHRHDVADLVWEAVKVRFRGGFYGRSLETIPLASFREVISPTSGEFVASYQTLGFETRDELAEESTHWLHATCPHYEADESTGHCNLDPLTEGSHNLLLGKEEQLAGLSWIRDAIIRDGGLSLGHLVLQSSDGKTPDIVLSDTKSLKHVYTQYRPVRKYKRDDGKALHLVHPFDVWLRDQPTHTDAPFCWTADARREGIGEDAVEVGSPVTLFLILDRSRGPSMFLHGPESMSVRAGDDMRQTG